MTEDQNSVSDENTETAISETPDRPKNVIRAAFIGKSLWEMETVSKNIAMAGIANICQEILQKYPHATQVMFIAYPKRGGSYGFNVSPDFYLPNFLSEKEIPEFQKYVSDLFAKFGTLFRKEALEYMTDFSERTVDVKEASQWVPSDELRLYNKYVNQDLTKEISDLFAQLTKQ